MQYDIRALLHLHISGWMIAGIVALCVLLQTMPAAALDDMGQRMPNFSNYNYLSALQAREDLIRESNNNPDNTGPEGHAFYGDRNALGQNRAFSETVCDTPGFYVGKIVNCIRLVIDTAVAGADGESGMLGAMGVFARSLVMALIIMVIVWFGARLATGSVQQLHQETGTLILKIAAVWLFTSTVPGQLLGGLYPYLFDGMETLAGVFLYNIGDIAPFYAACEADLATALPGYAPATEFDADIWWRIDCMIYYLFIGAPELKAGILLILALILLFTNVIGIMLFLAMGFVFLTLLLTLLRCVWVFISAYAMLGLLIVVSPIIIPLILFPATAKWFGKWLKAFISMFIQPMIVVAWLAFVFGLVGQSFFDQDSPYSLSAILDIPQGEWWDYTTYGRIADDLSDEARDILEQACEDEYGGDSEDEQKSVENCITELTTKVAVETVGRLRMMERDLVNVKLDIAEIDTKDRHIAVAAALSAVNWITDKTEDAFNAVASRIIPFKVTVVGAVTDGRGELSSEEPRDIRTVLMNLFKFFIVMMVLLPLLYVFSGDIGAMRQRLTNVRRSNVVGEGAMPGEQQVVGAAYATAGAVRGSVAGATGADGGPGGKAGAIMGAANGARQGYSRGADRTRRTNDVEIRNPFDPAQRQRGPD